ncbi:MAG: peptidyl-prolyl cis-trans isomerase [Polyangiaceae bacterium]|nr:peptidyl-prolyl cis-trans isomerase [Polyangiaceae bacterium]
MTRPSLLLAFLCLAACSDLTAPGAGSGKASPAAASAAPAAAAAQPGRIRASHILIGFAGARGPGATRTKEEAKQLAEAVQRRATGGRDFAELARAHSDDASNKERGGDLGEFDRAQMVQPFAEAAFALAPGEVSEVVETPFGFHVIKRAE